MKAFLITFLAGVLAAVCLAALAGCTFPDRGMPSRRCVDLAKSIVPEDPPPQKAASDGPRAASQQK
jgi:hypothetical protein